MTHIKDRDYYRSLTDQELLEEVRYTITAQTDWRELATVLAERLGKTLRDADWHYCTECAAALN